MAKLFSTSVKLRRYKSKNGNQVFIRIRTKSGVDIEIPVYDYIDYEKYPISVKKENWSKGLVTAGNYHIPIRELNFLIQKVEYNVKDAVRELLDKNLPITRESILKLTYINEDNARENDRKIASGEIITNDEGGAFASEEEFKEYIVDSEDPRFAELKKSMGVFRKIYILDYWEDFVKMNPDSYSTPKNAIQEYIFKTQDNCKATEFNASWLERLFKYLLEEGYSFRKDGTNRKPYTISTLAKYHKHLKSFGDFLFEDVRELSNQDYKRFSLTGTKKKTSLIKYKADPFINTHSLYKKEFDKFFFFKFKDKKQELARDMFVLQTWLGGLRQVDFYRLSKNNIQKDANGVYRIWFEQEKTESEVFQKINEHYLTPLIKKYSGGFDSFLKVHEYNKMLKSAALTAGLIRKLKFRYEYARDSKPTEEWHAIYEKISNSWARNCAASILTEKGFPDYLISRFIGHKSSQMVKHYKEIHQKDVEAMIDSIRPEKMKKL